MFERFTRDLRSTVKRAQDIAKFDGANAVEAPHLLIALTRESTGPTARALELLGLSEAAIRDAGDRELVSALRAVGVSAPAGARSVTSSGRTNPRWGQSAKLALERTLEIAVERADRSLEARHLLLALARAEAGIVPRLLAELDVSPGRIEAAFD
jgi:ATP-dependent Clp protease ATP-binding subunit ClpA